MKIEKILGFVLLIGGVGLILWSCVSIYQVFTGEKQAPQVLDLEMAPISLPITSPVPGMEIEPVEFNPFPSETIGQTTNMALYLILMGFFSMAGGRLATVGAKLLQTVKVYLREGKVLEQLKTQPGPSQA